MLCAEKDGCLCIAKGTLSISKGKAEVQEILNTSKSFVLGKTRIALNL